MKLRCELTYSETPSPCYQAILMSTCASVLTTFDNLLPLQRSTRVINQTAALIKLAVWFTIVYVQLLSKTHFLKTFS